MLRYRLLFLGRRYNEKSSFGRDITKHSRPWGWCFVQRTHCRKNSGCGKFFSWKGINVALQEFRWALLGSPLQGIRTIYYIFYLSNIFSLQNLNWEFIYLFIYFYVFSVNCIVCKLIGTKKVLMCMKSYQILQDLLRASTWLSFLFLW